MKTRAFALRLRENWEAKKRSLNLSELLELFRDVDSLWMFLTTHGMWGFGFKDPLLVFRFVEDEEDLTLLEVRMNVSRERDLEVAEYLKAHPLFHFHLDSITATWGKAEVSPPGIHKRVKGLQIKALPSECAELEVSPVTFYAASCGVHRLGMSHRIAAVQQAFAKKIAQALFNPDPSFEDPVSFFGVRSEDEERGALLAFCAGLMRAHELDLKAVDAEMTTSILAEELKRKAALWASKSFIRRFLDGSIGELRVGLEEGKLSFGCPELGEVESALFGRLRRYKDYERKLEEKLEELRGRKCAVLVDFTEQMGPADAYLLLCLLRKLEIKPSAIRIIGTPLTYPLASLSALYLYLSSLRSKEEIGEVEFWLCTEDPAVCRTLAEKAGKELGAPVIYFALGPTSHVLSFGKRLREIFGEKVVLVG